MSRRECVFWGWGEPGAGPSLPDHAAGLPALRARASTARWSRAPVALEDVRLRDAGADGRRRGRGSRASARARARRRGRAGGALPRQVLPRPAAPARRRRARTRPTRSSRRGRPTQVQAVLYACSEEGVAVVPFGGGTSVVGGLEPLRGRFDALISLDLGRLEGIESFDERSHAGVAAAAARGCPRPTTRSRSAASRSATRRRATSGRRSAAASRPARPASPRPATGGSRSNVVGAALRDAGGRAGDARGAGDRRRARRCSELVIGSEGVAGRDHRASGCACIRCRRRSATRAGRCSVRFEARPRRCATLGAGGDRARRRAALRRGRDADVVRAGRRAARRRARWALRAARPLRAASAAGRATAEAVARGARRAARRCAARARGRSGRGRARPGRRPATPARTCATTCSTAA